MPSTALPATCVCVSQIEARAALLARRDGSAAFPKAAFREEFETVQARWQ